MEKKGLYLQPDTNFHVQAPQALGHLKSTLGVPVKDDKSWYKELMEARKDRAGEPKTIDGEEFSEPMVFSKD